MKKRMKLLCILLLAFPIFLCGCTGKSKNDSAILKSSVVYRCADTTSFTADFYALKDGSLNYVRLKMPDGRHYTLPQMISASGARYTDGFQKEFWIKGDNATLRVLNEQGEWVLEHEAKVAEK